MLKKVLISILVGFLVTGFLVASRDKADKTVTLTFSSWGSESEVKVLQPIIKNYEKQNPQVKVEFLHIPQNYFQKLHLLFASNTAPDVVFLNNQYLPIYANANVLEPLDKYFSKGDLKNFYPNVLKTLEYSGKLYAIPRDISNLVVFYNKEIFNKYKVKYPQKDWTFDDYLKTAQKLTHLPQIFGTSFDEYPYFYLPFVMSNGGSFLPNDYNKKDSQKALDFYADLRTKYHVAPLRQEMSGATSAQLFLQGRLGMIISWRWVVPKFREDAKFDWDIINFPNGKCGSVSPLDSSGWAISKNSKHKSEAVKFIKYLSNYENISTFAKSGLIVPSRIDTANSKTFNNNDKPHNNRVFIDVIKTSKPTPTSINYNEILDQIKAKNEYRFNK